MPKQKTITIVVTPRQVRALNNLSDYCSESEAEHYEEMRQMGENTRGHIYHDLCHLNDLLKKNGIARE